MEPVDSTGAPIVPQTTVGRIAPGSVSPLAELERSKSFHIKGMDSVCRREERSSAELHAPSLGAALRHFGVLFGVILGYLCF